MRGTWLAGVLVLALSCSVALGGTITLDGADLTSTPGVTFPTQTPTVSGSSLQFPGAARPNEALLVAWDLFPWAGITGPTSLTFTAEMTTLTFGDQDPSFALGDGSNLARAGMFDGIRTFVAPGSTHDGSSATLSNFSSGPFAAGLPASFTLSGTYLLGPGGITSVTSVVTDGVSTSTNSSGILTPFAGAGSISFFFVGESAGEGYQIDSLTIDSPLIEGTPIPEPSSLLLSGAGGLLFSLFVTRRRRRKLRQAN